MFVAVIVIFGICWLPYHVYFIYSYHDPTITRYILLPCLLYILLPRPYYYKVYTHSMFTLYTPTTKLPLKGIYSCHYPTITMYTPTLFTLYTPTMTLLLQGIYSYIWPYYYKVYTYIRRPYYYKVYTPTSTLPLQGIYSYHDPNITR